MNLENELVEERTVSCDGQENVSPHPKVYLEIDNIKNVVVCPYCSRKFIYKENH